MFEKIIQAPNIDDFVTLLGMYKCNKCSLSEHDNRVVVCRGNPEAKIMLVGEAPGLVEDQQGKAFVGPAGVLMEKIFTSVGINMNEDVYCTNVCRCRPIAKKYSGKQNYTPLAEQIKTCTPYLKREIELIKPDIVIAAGGVATKALLGEKTTPKMAIMTGRFAPPVPGSAALAKEVFIIYHPAWIIYKQRQGPQAALEARETMWLHMRYLRETIHKRGIYVRGNVYECSICDEAFKSNWPHTMDGRYLCPRCAKERINDQTDFKI